MSGFFDALAAVKEREREIWCLQEFLATHAASPPSTTFPVSQVFQNSYYGDEQLSIDRFQQCLDEMLTKQLQTPPNQQLLTYRYTHNPYHTVSDMTTQQHPRNLPESTSSSRPGSICGRTSGEQSDRSTHYETVLSFDDRSPTPAVNLVPTAPEPAGATSSTYVPPILCGQGTRVFDLDEIAHDVMKIPNPLANSFDAKEASRAIKRLRHSQKKHTQQHRSQARKNVPFFMTMFPQELSKEQINCLLSFLLHTVFGLPFVHWSSYKYKNKGKRQVSYKFCVTMSVTEPETEYILNGAHRAVVFDHDVFYVATTDSAKDAMKGALHSFVESAKDAAGHVCTKCEGTSCASEHCSGKGGCETCFTNRRSKLQSLPSSPLGFELAN